VSANLAVLAVYPVLTDVIDFFSPMDLPISDLSNALNSIFGTFACYELSNNFMFSLSLSSILSS